MDDDTIKAFSKAYKDRLLQSPAITAEIEARAHQEAERRAREQERTREADTVYTQIRQRGQQAVNSLATMAAQAKLELDKASEELGKATREEAFTGTLNASVLDPNQFLQHIRTLGDAIEAETKAGYDSAIQDGCNAVLGAIGPLSEDHAEELVGVFSTFNRMRGDPNQVRNAQTYLLQSLFHFVANRAAEYGAREKEATLTSKRSLKDKVTQANAVVVAKAELLKENLPPAAPKSTGGSTAYPISDEGYSRAQEDGRLDVAQAIVDEMAKRGMGQKVRR